MTMCGNLPVREHVKKHTHDARRFSLLSLPSPPLLLHILPAFSPPIPKSGSPRVPCPLHNSYITR
eukprot:767832-Hanusia_phi.AAC.1